MNNDKPIMGWALAGVLFAIINLVTFLVAHRPIGASTAFPYIGNVIFPAIENEYWEEIKTSGYWEAWFLLGGFVGALITSKLTKTFRLTLTPVYWKEKLNMSTKSRVLFAFLGGFLLIFGARMAGGCTSGHMFSGGMQLAVSSLWFAIFAFIGGLVVANILYRRRYRG